MPRKQPWMQKTPWVDEPIENAGDTADIDQRRQQPSQMKKPPVDVDHPRDNQKDDLSIKLDTAVGREQMISWVRITVNAIAEDGRYLLSETVLTQELNDGLFGVATACRRRHCKGREGWSALQGLSVRRRDPLGACPKAVPSYPVELSAEIRRERQHGPASCLQRPTKHPHSVIPRKKTNRPL